MNAWPMVVRLAEEDLIEPRHLAAIEATVRSAKLARMGHPHDAVAAALLERLEDGLPIDEAIARVEELVAIHHNRMLIESGRGPAITLHHELDGVVVRWPLRAGPVHAA